MCFLSVIGQLYFSFSKQQINVLSHFPTGNNFFFNFQFSVKFLQIFFACKLFLYIKALSLLSIIYSCIYICFPHLTNCFLIQHITVLCIRPFIQTFFNKAACPTMTILVRSERCMAMIPELKLQSWEIWAQILDHLVPHFQFLHPKDNSICPQSKCVKLNEIMHHMCSSYCLTHRCSKNMSV